jgi:hypothetical protein
VGELRSSRIALSRIAVAAGVVAVMVRVDEIVNGPAAGAAVQPLQQRRRLGGTWLSMTTTAPAFTR